MATETAAAYKNFVGGEWVDAVDGAAMDVINPATDGKDMSMHALEDFTPIKHVMAKID